MPRQQSPTLGKNVFYILGPFFLTFHSFPPLGFPDQCLPLARMQNSIVTSSYYLPRPADPAKPITETPVRMRVLCALHLPGLCIPHYLHDEPGTCTRKITQSKTSRPDLLLRPTSRDKGTGDLKLATGGRKGIQLGLKCSNWQSMTDFIQPQQSKIYPTRTYGDGHFRGCSLLEPRRGEMEASQHQQPQSHPEGEQV